MTLSRCHAVTLSRCSAVTLPVRCSGVTLSRCPTRGGMPFNRHSTFGIRHSTFPPPLPAARRCERIEGTRPRFPMTLLLAVLLGAALGAPVQAQAPAKPPASATDRTAEAYYQFILGRRLESDGNTEGAVAAYERAADLDPKGAEIRAELAGLYARQDRAREAIDWANKALVIDASSREAHRILGLVYAALSDQPAAGAALGLGTAPEEFTTRAIVNLEQADSDNVVDPSLHYSLGRMYLRRRLYAKAIDAFRRLQEEQPGVSDASLMLADALAGAGRLDRGAADAERRAGRAAGLRARAHPAGRAVRAERRLGAGRRAVRPGGRARPDERRAEAPSRGRAAARGPARGGARRDPRPRARAAGERHRSVPAVPGQPRPRGPRRGRGHGPAPDEGRARQRARRLRAVAGARPASRLRGRGEGARAGHRPAARRTGARARRSRRC